jgi:hypothetical protein
MRSLFQLSRCLQGRPAYRGMRSEQIKYCVMGGLRPTLPPPPAMHPDVAEVISFCWAQAPDARPAFVSVLARLQELLGSWARELHGAGMATTTVPTSTTSAGGMAFLR